MRDYDNLVQDSMLFITALIAHGAFAVWTPVGENRAMLESGLAMQPWARYTGTRSTTGALYCTGSTTTGYATAFSVPASSTLWAESYTVLQNNLDDTPYLLNTSGRFYLCEDDPLTATNGTQLPNTSYVIYHQCSAGATLPPSQSPTRLPTNAPTAALDDDAFYDAYGPINETECTDNGGTDWGPIFYENGVDMAVRFCCGVPQCSGIFSDPSLGKLDCACNPAPGEVRVRNNGGGCTFCPDAPFPSMVYCVNTSGCNGAVNGSEFDCSGFLFDACTAQGYYPDPYTASPTAAPTPRLELTECWEYDDDGCSSSIGTWCATTDFKRFSNYTIHPRFLDQERMTIDAFYELGAAQRNDVHGVVLMYSQYANETQGSCWCTDRSLNWMPYGPSPIITVDAVQTSLSYTAPQLPFPRLLLRYGDLGSGTYKFLKQLTLPVAAFLYVQNVSGAYTVTEPDDLPDISILSPTQAMCSFDGCTWVSSLPTEMIVSSTTLETCRYVCINMFYVENEDGTRNAPLSVAIRNDINNEQDCGAMTWMNSRALQPLLLFTQLQRYSENAGFRGSFQSVPWLNFTRNTAGYYTNCKLVANRFCGPKGRAWSNWGAWYCDGLNADTGVYTLYNSINYSGITPIDIASRVSCDDPPYPLSLGHSFVIPDLGFESTPTIPTEYHTIVRTQLTDIFWRIFMEYPTEDECTGQYTQDIVYTGNGQTFSVNVTMEWTDLTGQTGCVGVSGCSMFEAGECDDNGISGYDIAGCQFVSSTSTTTTTASATVGTFGTFPPVSATSGVPMGGRFDTAATNHLLSYATIMVVSAVVFLSVGAYLVWFSRQAHNDTQDDEEVPMIMG